MKVTILLLCGMALTAAHPTWDEYKGKYKREFKNSTEEASRRNAFEANLQIIKDHEQKKNSTFNMGVNDFTDMTIEQFRAAKNGYKATSSQSNTVLVTATTTTPPATVDWRTNGSVTPVKNQLQCGSCWAFSATGALEGQYFRKTGKLASLSEQQLVDCSGGTYKNQGCNGGAMTSAFNYIKANGANSGALYPYVAVQGTCKFLPKNISATLTGYVSVTSQSESALQKAVGTVGPISVAIDASHSSFQHYSSGVYFESTCSSTSLNHGVLVVGYGTDTKGGDYWIVKNSWGTGWGEGGYVKMARNKNNNCGIATAASYPTV
ncbi:procathepsin L [Procambarus clarkii]|uniref:procathepsin L n=1 Tax=Procambarus clarkii TaxID=6728 RepID=UPI003741FD66